MDIALQRAFLLLYVDCKCPVKLFYAYTNSLCVDKSKMAFFHFRPRALNATHQLHPMHIPTAMALASSQMATGICFRISLHHFPGIVFSQAKCLSCSFKFALTYSFSYAYC